MEVSALKYSGGVGLHGRSALLRLQSDERLVALVRRGNSSAFEVLVGRYESRLLAFCRHMLGSREDAEDVLQEVLAAAFNALQSDDRPINVRPWLYRICRNRSLNHLRRSQPVGVDSMDVHLSDNGASTADKVHDREEFRLLVGDIHSLPETQKTALVLREMDALSYEQIAEAMETSVPSVKSLLVRARISLAEAAEARLLSCEEVRIELGEVAEGLRRRPSPLVRRHLRACARCEAFQSHLKQTNKALAALLPLVGPLALLKRFALSHLGHSAAGGSSATAAGSSAGALGSSAAIGSGATISSAGSVISAGVGTIATKAAAGLAVTALVTAGAVEVSHDSRRHVHHPTLAAARPEAVTFLPPAPRSVPRSVPRSAPAPRAIAHSHWTAAAAGAPLAEPHPEHVKTAAAGKRRTPAAANAKTKGPLTTAEVKSTDSKSALSTPAPKPVANTPVRRPVTPAASAPPPAQPPGRTQTETDPTILTSSSTSTPLSAAPPTPQPETTTGGPTTGTTTTTTNSTDSATATTSSTESETATTSSTDSAAATTSSTVTVSAPPSAPEPGSASGSDAPGAGGRGGMQAPPSLFGP